jgi:hypothetical protein
LTTCHQLAICSRNSMQRPSQIRMPQIRIKYWIASLPLRRSPRHSRRSIAKYNSKVEYKRQVSARLSALQNLVRIPSSLSSLSLPLAFNWSMEWSSPGCYHPSCCPRDMEGCSLLAWKVCSSSDCLGLTPLGGSYYTYLYSYPVSLR